MCACAYGLRMSMSCRFDLLGNFCKWIRSDVGIVMNHDTEMINGSRPLNQTVFT